jgi:CRP/FNR family transcriptional activator FtrB
MGTSLLKPVSNGGKVPSIEATLRTMPGFDRLESPVLEHIASFADIAEAHQGQVLFREGGVPESLHVLLEGHVSLTGTAADASCAVVHILGPGSSLAFSNTLTGEPYLMNAEAVTPLRLIRVAATPMRAVMTAEPASAMAMMHAMSGELEAMTRQVIDLKVRIAAQRLGSYLLNMVSDPTAAQADFRLPVHKGLLASWLGCRAENLSRAFVGLRAYGVETHGSRVLLHDVARLRSYAGAALPDAEAMQQAGGVAQPPVEKILGDAFRLRSNRPRGF